MNTLLRLCLISCASFCSIQAIDSIRVLEKDINLGNDPKTNNKIVIKAFAFLKNNEKEEETRWYGVFPYAKELVFYCSISDQSFVLPVNDVVTAKDSTIVEYNLNDKTFDAKIVKPGTKATSLFTMKLTLTPEPQLFQEFVILLAKADKAALQAFVSKNSVEKVIEAADNAIATWVTIFKMSQGEAQGTLLIVADDKDTFDKIKNGTTKLSKPLQLTGKYVFLPADAVVEAMLAEEAQQQEVNQKA